MSKPTLDLLRSRRAEAHRRSCVSHGYACVVPPYVLDQIALNGTERQREAVLRTRLTDESVRFARALATMERSFLGAPPRLRRGPAPGAFQAGVGALAVRRSIFTARNRDVLPGDRVRSEGQDATGDDAVDEAYDGLGATHALYAEGYERDSIDDAGMELVATVHYEEDYDNAYWDGSQMVFGDGDGESFNRFTIAVDVIGHELTHGVIQSVGGLVYMNQPGALNESISDVFGSLVKQYVAQEEANDADWLIGEGLLTDNVDGRALRSMAEPGSAYDDRVLGKDPQPGHMRDYVHTTADYGGVHINSGIPNHAFYLIATELGGFAWERAGLIWYDALTSPGLHPRTSFRTFAQITHRVAARLFGPGSDEALAVRSGWEAVGIRVGPPVRARPRIGGRSRGDRQPWRASQRRDRQASESRGRGAQAEEGRTAGKKPS